jgi:hypothetical protein
LLLLVTFGTVSFVMLCCLSYILFGRVPCAVYYLLLGFSWLLWLAVGHDLEPSSGCCCCYMQVLCFL